MNSICEFVLLTKKVIKPKDIIVFFSIILVFFTTRLTNILSLPIFSDEGIYIRWARVAAYDPAWRFISLTDGKQPLQTWGTIPFIKIFPNDLLLAGRLFAVSTGFIALLGIFALCGYLWGKKGAVIGSILYIVTPYFLFYDRIALVDSGVNAAFIWILFFSLLLPKYRRLDIAMVFGIVSGIGLLAKSSVALFLALSALGFLILVESEHAKENLLFSFKNLRSYLSKIRCKLVDYYGLFAVTFVIAISLYLVQKLFSPFFHYIAEKNLTFIQSPAEWLAAPFSLVSDNLRYVTTYVAWESGWVPVVIGIAGFIVIFRRRPLLAAYMGLWTIMPFIMIVNFNKVIFPRYLIFFPTLLTIFSVAFLASIKDARLRTVSIIATCLLLASLSYPIIFNITATSLPPVDRGQYIEGRTAVWGAQELMEIIRKDTLQTGKRAVVLAEGNFGLIADVLEVMKKPNDKIDIEGYWPLNEEHILAKQNDSQNRLVYIVFSHRSDFPVYWREIMDEIMIFEKPGDDDSAVYLFKLKPVETKLLSPIHNLTQ